MRHDDLGDDELLARLLQRDVDLDEARLMVQYRDRPEYAQVIARLLDVA